MLNRSTSSLRDQQRESVPRALSKTSLRSRKPPGATLIRAECQPSSEQCTLFDSAAHTASDDREHIADIALIGMAAHDLRHPAAAIQIYSELLAEAVGHTVSKDQGTLIDSIHSISKFMLDLLDDTVDLISARAGTVRLHTTRSTVTAIVRKSVEMSRPLAAKKQTILNLVQMGEPLPMLLDTVKIGKVFSNLIENAIKYCQPGARIHVRVSSTANKVLVSVQDNGPGISLSDLEALFTPFQRTRARALSEEPGTGLGLAIARYIVELHGGSIQAESQMSKGTTFSVCLPAQIRRASKKS